MNLIEPGFLGRRTLNALIFILVVGLGLVLITSEKGVSGVMEQIGAFVSRLFRL
jgi:hypothetical protein